MPRPLWCWSNKCCVGGCNKTCDMSIPLQAPMKVLHDGTKSQMKNCVDENICDNLGWMKIVTHLHDNIQLTHITFHWFYNGRETSEGKHPKANVQRENIQTSKSFGFLQSLIQIPSGKHVAWSKPVCNLNICFYFYFLVYILTFFALNWNRS